MSNDEISRVLNNPDNLIISDSLAGRIDFEDSKPEIRVTLTSKEQTVFGNFSGYSIESFEDFNEIAVSFLVSESSLDSILQIAPGLACSILLNNNTMGGSIFKIDIDSKRAELQVTVFLKSYT